MDIQDLLAHLDVKVIEVMMELMAYQVLQVQKEIQVWMDYQEYLVFEALQGHLV
jgi:hypothetical protein